MKKFTVAFLAALAAAFAIPAGAQVIQAILSPSQNTSRIVSAVSTHVPLVVKYVGDNTLGGNVAVDAGTGDLTFTEGAVGSSAADDSLECPVSGALGGVIDVSDAACNTLGEVVDIINASANWRAIIVDGLRTDTSVDALITISETAATAEDGLNLTGDTAVTFDVAIGALPQELRSIKRYLGPREQGARMIPNPLLGSKPVFYFLSATTTYGSGTSTLEGYCVLQRLRSGGSTAGSETVTQIFSLAGGATTAAGTVDARQFGGLACSEGEKLFVRVNNSAANTASVASLWAQQVSVR